MKIKGIAIWLDDIRPMPDGFDIHCVTVEEALAVITATNSVSFISFDNDLGEGMLEGYDLAKEIERRAFLGQIKPFKWQVHSANPQGQKNIKAAMKQAELFWKEQGC
jgi:hypothetical protein